MTRLESRLFHTSTALVGGTGLVYAWMRYLVPAPETWAVVNHPWQPHVQHLHILVAPLLVLGVGHLWATHALAYRRSGQRSGRRSGLILLFTALPMIVSGALIQTAVSPAWRNMWIAVHLISSALWLIGYLGHLFRHRVKSISNGWMGDPTIG